MFEDTKEGYSEAVNSWSTKHYTESSRLSNRNKNMGVNSEMNQS